ncbi:alpha-amylase [Parasegetibacter sp. NRK P23]|uniref:alpha-amylase n=1 Tax=Parasegetibacter sp. NRK P23 TaxID=2942999 RepID=UPI002044702C|nr:alpha-amylase [Parasegetibacter sp. NRK P23]MCM5529849.1 alpha-amylase [Parasegetibacter sp. NRK P23]
MPANLTILQFFHWYTPNDGNWWKHVSETAPFIKSAGFTHVWLPPAYKSGWGASEPGYAVYDLFDLGEFDQKGSVRTKHGTRDEYLKAIRDLQEQEIDVLADIVLNHKHGADEQERITAREVNPDNRSEHADHTIEIDAYTKFNFPGRKGQYSDFIWDQHCFTGVSDRFEDRERIFLIEHGHQEGWDVMMDDEMGNFDYLMGADIDYRNPHVREELKRWGKWYVETTGINGFRLDAVKHINYRFFLEWLPYLKHEFQRDFFCIAEYWSANTESLLNWIDAMEGHAHLFDVPLHFNFYEASIAGEDFDMRTIFDNTLLQRNPQRAITFVDNHDSQPFQSLESFVEYWFKPLANALILLREQGIPCVFYPSMFGAAYTEKNGEEEVQVELNEVPWIRVMIKVRAQLAYGIQHDYFDHGSTIGWVRWGVDEITHSGCAVVLTNGGEGFKSMHMGDHHANAVFVDVTGNIPEEITTNDEGWADFRVNERSVSVWVRKEAAEQLN